MPLYRPSILLSDAYGSVGSVTFYHRKGRCYTRRRVKASYPGTPAQLEHLAIHRRAMAAWASLERDTQLKWIEYETTAEPHRPPFDHKAHISGNNLFVSAYHGFALMGNEHTPVLSSAVNSAYDPMNAGLYDKENASVLGGGIAFQKFTGSRGKSGASDANPEFIAKIRSAMDGANVSYQMAELGKVDQGGGGTIAYHAAKYGMNVLDAGVAVLSMHAPWEITHKEDLCQIYEGYKAFLQIK